MAVPASLYSIENLTRKPGEDYGNGSVSKLNAKALERDLARNIEGEVRFDSASIGLYATDSSNFREIPIGVVVPRSSEDVVATHRICSEYGAPILNRGGGTSLSGETVNFAVVIDHSKYLHRIGETDVERRMVTVQPGAINEQVNKHTGKDNLVFGPDPSTHAYCTIGGNAGNNSCGIHSVQSQLYGPGPRTSDNVHSMEIVLYGGEHFRVGVEEEKDLDRIIRQGGRKGEIYRALRDRALRVGVLAGVAAAAIAAYKTASRLLR
jgi:FAD/FMN-containing dehydrogenase